MLSYPIKSTMDFHGKQLRKPSVQDIMKIFHEPAFVSTSDSFEDQFVIDPCGDIVALSN